MKNIEASVVHTADRLPEVAERLITLLDKVQRVAEQVEQQNVPERVNGLLNHADRTLSLLDGKLTQLETRELSQQTRATLTSWQNTAEHVNQLLARVNGEHGLLTSAQRTSDALGDMAHSADGLTSELERTLRDVSEAATSVQGLADALERQPDMLLKGRGRTAGPEAR
jgi:paraquat-inducible protein B